MGKLFVPAHEANAALTSRVVACVKACAGINPDAVPDLLAACKEFVRKCECGEASSRRSYAEMKAAIQKAEGE